MTIIAIDGTNEEEFRRSIEYKLRAGKAAEAADRLRALIAPYAGPGRILPDRFLTILPSDLTIEGWDRLAANLKRHDRPEYPITALSIAFGWPGEDVPAPDAEGRLNPLIETGYLTDEAYPFSQSGRDDLLDGYSFGGCTWANDFQGVDTDLQLRGVEDLHGALAMLEARLLSSDEPDEDEIAAGSLGSCLLSVLLIQAVGARIASDGLPRPLCVMAGSNGVYPYFDAPVVGISEEARRAAAHAEQYAVEASASIPGPRYSSLLVTSIPRARKRAVLVLEEVEEQTEVRLARLRGLAPPEDEGAEPVEMTPLSEPEPQEPMPGAIPVGALLAKKPVRQDWDFRDMLSPRKPDLTPVAHGPVDQEPEFEPHAAPVVPVSLRPVEPPPLFAPRPVVPAEMRSREPEPEFEPHPEPIAPAALAPLDPEPEFEPETETGPAVPAVLEPVAPEPEFVPEPAPDMPAPVETFDPPLPPLPEPAAIQPTAPGFSLFDSYLELDRQPIRTAPAPLAVPESAEPEEPVYEPRFAHARPPESPSRQPEPVPPSGLFARIRQSWRDWIEGRI